MNRKVLEISVVIAIILISIVLIGITSAYGFHDNRGDLFVQKICSIAMNGTHNCDEHWIIGYFPDKRNIQTPDEEWGSAFAIPGDIPKEHKYSICQFIPQLEQYGEEVCTWNWLIIGNIKVDSCWDEQCQPLLWHELRHLKCDCDWHENMTSTRGTND